LACVYGLVTFTKGCNPNSVLTNASGGSRAIAIVDAFHAANVRADLNAYSAQFGLPPTNKSNFVIWYCGAKTCNQTTPPARNEGWAQETTLDVQMAHALAPKAKIILVEARSDFYSDMYVAVRKAAQLVAAAGGGQVSMSWGSSEFSSQTTYAGGDKSFQTAKVVFFASSGDSPEPSWPSVSPWVVSVGGTSVVRNTSTGAFAREASWDSAGGGPSAYIQRPYYQPASAGPKRNSPDISAVANPSTGVWVRYLNSWYIFGGTSVSAPIAAAIVNNAGLFLANSPAELGAVYHGRGTTTNWYDVVTGTCGPNGKYPARSGYDYCGGIGAPRGRGGK
jgi:subtilase family serine protease